MLTKKTIEELRVKRRGIQVRKEVVRASTINTII